jgi:putative transposase
MGRYRRIILPDYPHHVVQRGSRRGRLFFSGSDHTTYLSLLSRLCPKFGVEIWAYCLMPNHTHFMSVPKSTNALSKLFRAVNHAYSLRINEREGWTGHLWQGTFKSYVMDHDYMITAARYIENNPVSAGMVERAEDYPWSSARAHFAGEDDGLVKVKPLLEFYPRWGELVHSTLPIREIEAIRKHEKTGLPLGGKQFISRLEAQAGRSLADSWDPVGQTAG